jgi:hypothetical protein
MKNIILPILTGVIFLIIGILCLLRARQIQKWALRYYEHNPNEGKWNPFLGYMKSDAYVLVTRVVGIMALTLVIFLAFGLLRGWIE